MGLLPPTTHLSKLYSPAMDSLAWEGVLQQIYAPLQHKAQLY